MHKLTSWHMLADFQQKPNKAHVWATDPNERGRYNIGDEVEITTYDDKTVQGTIIDVSHDSDKILVKGK